MSKAPSPLLGYNNNVRHKNRVFHIQTEDSGIKHPHIITHLFMDGGRILKSIKTSYAEHLGTDKLGDLVRQMMKEQHKGMFIALRDGQFDHLVEPDAGEVIHKVKTKSRAPAASIPDDTGVAATGPFPALTNVLLPDESPVTTRDDAVLAGREATEVELTLDLDTLERASTEISPRFIPATDLPPPPANVLRDRAEPGTGRYKTLRDEGAPISRDEAAPRSRIPKSEPAKPPRPKSEPPKPPRPAAGRRAVDTRLEPEDAANAPAPPSSRATKHSSRPPPPREREGSRYAPARPASIFGQAKPQRGTSIFGEDLISDKSLDEVILSYLAEDLEDEKK